MKKQNYRRKSSLDFGQKEQSERKMNALSKGLVAFLTGRPLPGMPKKKGKRVHAPHGVTSASRALHKGPRRMSSPNFPAYVTDGANADGTLRVRVFKSRAEADEAGFPWVGR